MLVDVILESVDGKYIGAVCLRPGRVDPSIGIKPTSEKQVFSVRSPDQLVGRIGSRDFVNVDRHENP